MADQRGIDNSYAIDLVLCIDGTGGMFKLFIQAEEAATDLYARFRAMMEAQGKAIRDNWFRVKAIIFRDYKFDGDGAMEESEFFDMTTPEGSSALKRFLQSSTVGGGGDRPENALEALHLALKSDWITVGGRRRRHLIALFTDAPAVPLQDIDRASHPNYPQDAPADLNALKDMIDNCEGQEMSYAGRRGRLIVFAPEDCGWDWVRTLNYGYLMPTEPDGNCEDMDFEAALEVLVRSV